MPVYTHAPTYSPTHTQFCELCRIYPEQLLLSYVLKFCQALLPACQNSSISKEALNQTEGVIRDYIVTQQAYGQVLITQFISK